MRVSSGVQWVMRAEPAQLPVNRALLYLCSSAARLLWQPATMPAPGPLSSQDRWTSRVINPTPTPARCERTWTEGHRCLTPPGWTSSNTNCAAGAVKLSLGWSKSPRHISYMFHWKLRVVVMPNLSSLAAPRVLSWCHQWRQSWHHWDRRFSVFWHHVCRKHEQQIANDRTKIYCKTQQPR